MKQNIRKKSNIYAYLNSIKVLETGNNQDIKAAKKAYYKQYKSEWRKAQRKQTKQFVVILTENEADQIITGAKKHRLTPTKFIKQSTFAYLRKQYLPVDPLALATIRQLLAMNYAALRKLFDENRMPFETGRSLLIQMSELEKRVIEELYHPKESKDAAV
jgi:hypothetical protein